MKAISIWQPWASAIALGLKHIETRRRRLNFLGELAICAAQKSTGDMAAIFDGLLVDHPEILRAFVDVVENDFHLLPFGCVVAVVQVRANGNIEFWSDSISQTERALGDYSKGRFALEWNNVIRLKNPVPVIGRQSLFNLSADVEAKVREQL